MNKFSTVLFSAALASLLISCGGAKKDDSSTTDQQPANNSSTANINNIAAGVNAMAGGAMASANNAYAEKMKERRAKGDTLAMPYADLEKFLPQSMDGYTAGKPNGASVNMGQASYSSAEVQFKKDNGDWVKVAILDYNQAYNMFAAASAVWKMGLSVDNDNEKSNSVKFDNTDGGLETFHKTSKTANIALGIGSRFWVTVEASNQADVSNVESIAKSIDLSKLNSL